MDDHQIDAVSRLTTDWHSMLRALPSDMRRRGRTITLGVEDPSITMDGWFGFYRRDFIYDKCTHPCKFHHSTRYTTLLGKNVRFDGLLLHGRGDSNGGYYDYYLHDKVQQSGRNGGPVYERIRYNDADQQRRKKKKKKAEMRSDGALALPLLDDSIVMDPPLIASIRNEPDGVKIFGDKAQNTGSLKQQRVFGQSAFDITLNYNRNATIWSNYLYVPFHKGEFSRSRWNKASEPKHNAMCVFITNCVQERLDVIFKLRKYVPLRSYGACAHNAKIEHRTGDRSEEKVNELSQCRFYLAFENSRWEDYVTEKFFEGFKAHGKTIMIYRGTPNIREYVSDRRAFINIDDFDSLDELGRFLRRMNNDPEEFEKYFSMTDDEAETLRNELNSFHYKNVIHSTCKLCTAVAEMTLARQALFKIGLAPLGDTPLKVTQDQYDKFRSSFSQELSEKQLTILDEIYDMGYGRYWRRGNHVTNWNEMSYVAPELNVPIT